MIKYAENIKRVFELKEMTFVKKIFKAHGKIINGPIFKRFRIKSRDGLSDNLLLNELHRQHDLKQSETIKEFLRERK